MRMRRDRFRRAAIVAGGLFLLTAASPAMDLYLKTTGGLLRSRFGDIDLALRDWSASWEATVAARPNWGYEQTGTLRQSGSVLFGAEVIASFGRRWAVGIGLALLYSNFTDKYAPLYVQMPDDKIEYTSPTKVASYPFYALGQYTVPLAKKWDAFVSAGMGFAPTKYVHREKFRNLKDKDFGVALVEIASGTGPMVLGGAGLRYAIDPALGLFAEAGYVLAKVGSLEGDLGEGATGVLYSYREYDEALDFWQTKLRLHASDPTGSTIRAVRKADLNLSGFSFRLGLTMKL